MTRFFIKRKHNRALAKHEITSGDAVSARIPIRPPRSLGRDTLRRFAQNKLAIGGLAIVLILAIAAIFADDWFIAPFLGRGPHPLIARTRYDKISYGPSGAFPSSKYWMGTDLIGRDLWSRIVLGARISLTVGLLAQLIAIVVGVPLGAIAGWRGRYFDYAVMRLVDIISAIPGLLFAYLIMAPGPGFWNVILAIGLRSWVGTCRLTRAQFLVLREKGFVEAARLRSEPPNGASFSGICCRTRLGPIIVSLTLGVPGAIFAEASLSFLGIGINPPMPSWGQMLGRDGIANMSYFWHLALFPALAIAFTLLGFTLMGDGLQEAIDPQSARRTKNA